MLTKVTHTTRQAKRGKKNTLNKKKTFQSLRSILNAKVTGTPIAALYQRKCLYETAHSNNL